MASAIESEACSDSAELQQTLERAGQMGQFLLSENERLQAQLQCEAQTNEDLRRLVNRLQEATGKSRDRSRHLRDKSQGRSFVSDFGSERSTSPIESARKLRRPLRTYRNNTTAVEELLRANQALEAENQLLQKHCASLEFGEDHPAQWDMVSDGEEKRERSPVPQHIVGALDACDVYDNDGSLSTSSRSLMTPRIPEEVWKHVDELDEQRIEAELEVDRLREQLAEVSAQCQQSRSSYSSLWNKFEMEHRKFQQAQKEMLGQRDMLEAELHRQSADMMQSGISTTLLSRSLAIEVEGARSHELEQDISKLRSEIDDLHDALIRAQNEALVQEIRADDIVNLSRNEAAEAELLKYRKLHEDSQQLISQLQSTLSQLDQSQAAMHDNTNEFAENQEQPESSFWSALWAAGGYLSCGSLKSSSKVKRTQCQLQRFETERLSVGSMSTVASTTLSKPSSTEDDAEIRKSESLDSWDASRGHVAQWLSVDDSSHDLRKKVARLTLCGSGVEMETAKSVWERCRRGTERRWTLA